MDGFYAARARTNAGASLDGFLTAMHTHFTAVHDAYGTHAANMNAMGVFLREAFVEVHRVDNLENFRDACARTLAGVYLAQDTSMGFPEAYAKALAKMPAPLDMGTLDLEGVMNSPYFFA